VSTRSRAAKHETGPTLSALRAPRRDPVAGRRARHAATVDTHCSTVVNVAPPTWDRHSKCYRLHIGVVVAEADLDADGLAGVDTTPHSISHVFDLLLCALRLSEPVMG
jgi:hypothetical protein